MNRTFQNSSQVECSFTDEGITIGGAKQKIFFPYGRIDTINLSLLGVLQVGYRSTICTFAVDRGDRSDIKQLIREAKELMKTAPDGEIQTIDLTSTLSPEEQLKELKTQFIQGTISKTEYDAKRRQLRNL